MLKEYLEGIKDLTLESNELTHRLFLHNLLDGLKDHFNKEFKIEHEPKKEQGSQPDFRISYQGLNIGYIENKRVGENLSQLLKNKQILKYLELNPNLMLTDYLNFMWVGKDENNAPLIKKEISVASPDELSKPLKPKPQTERDLIELFKSFFNHEAAPITNAKDFATHLSPRTRYLKDALIKYQEKTQDAIAHLNLSQAFKEEFKKPLKENDALQIILTNTLIQPSEIAADRGLQPIFEKELKSAQEIKKDEKILIITGNPPYSGASSNEGLFEWEVKATYGIEPEFQTIEIEKGVKLTDKIKTLLKNIQTQKQGDKSVKNTNKDALKKLKQIYSRYKLQNEQNPKWILDDYVKFMRFAQNKIESLGHGLFGFISNNAFLDNPTFRGLRRSLLKCYDELYILNLHGNARKKEETPQGADDENVFNIKQGVSINLFVKKVQTTKQKIHYYDVYGERAEKYAFLAQNDLNSIEWLEIAPREPFYLLLPLKTPLLDEYEQGFSVQDMFQVGSTGICSQRDQVVFHKDKESLLKLLKDFSTLEPSELRRKYNIKDAQGWKLGRAIENVKKNQHELEKYIVWCQYRPFDYRWTYYTDKSCGFLARPVYDVFKHMFPPPPPTNPKTPNQTRKNAALNTPRQLKNNDKSWTQCFISSCINDQGLSSGGNGAGVNYPLYQFNNPNYTENFTPEFRSFIDKHYNHSFESLEILGYIYALLYSPNYRKRYEGFLKIDYPKILFTNNKDLFRVLSLLGIELIGLHVLNQESLNHSFEKLKDATIGESYYKEAHDCIIKKPAYNEPEQRLYINHSAYFRGVSKEIHDYMIGGYGVLDKYLKSHKNESCDFDHVSNIIKVIARTIEIQKTLGFLTNDLPHLKGNDSQALMQEILQNPPPPI
ncbi:hypothetical protein VN0644_00980 [Helicobacter pylori]